MNKKQMKTGQFKKPPVPAKWLLCRLRNYQDNYRIVGDLEEMFYEIYEREGSFKASFWYWYQCVNTVCNYITNIFYWSAAMYKNILKIIVRNLIKYKGYSFISISGLAVGMTCFILILLWVHNELSYDKFNVNIDRIYRLETGVWDKLGPAIGRVVGEQIPEVESSVRFMFRENRLLEWNEKVITVNRFAWADKTMFDVFTFNLIQGNPQTVLKDPYSLVVTESIAQRLFGEENPVGKTVHYNNQYDYKITGVMENVGNFHLPFDVLASFTTLETRNKRRFFDEFYDGWEHPTYLMLSPNHNVPEVESKIDAYLKNNNIFEDPDYTLRPLKEVYFAKSGQGKHGNLQLVYVFSVVAFFLIGIAGINFINLTTAKAARRAKEIGIRKVIGSQKRNLIVQFLIESVLLSLASLILAIILVCLLLSWFNNLVLLHISPGQILSPVLLAGLFAAAILLGVIAGIYPAFYLASYKAVNVLKGENYRGKTALFFRRGLIVLQFFISVIIIIGTFTVLEQLRYMKHKDLGFEKEYVLYLRLNEKYRTQKDTFKENLLRNPDIIKASYSCLVPGEGWWQWGLEVNGKPGYIKVNSIDPDFIDLLELELVQGRNFSWQTPADRWTENGRNPRYILNETAVKYLGLKSPLGRVGGETRLSNSEIIGVVKDFHFSSLHKRIEPLLFYWAERQQQILNLKLSTDNLPETINYIKSVWEQFSPEFPFEYTFLDEAFDQLYKSEERLARIFQYFSFLTIFIALLGLFGLASYIAEQKKKEFGIRKVCGASVLNIIGIISKEFSIWILLANLIAWPAGYFLLNKWLQNFAYHISIGLWIFLVSAFIAYSLALLTVSFQAVRAATANPVESIRHE